jgi:hypothetical protein
MHSLFIIVLIPECILSKALITSPSQNLPLAFYAAFGLAYFCVTHFDLFYRFCPGNVGLADPYLGLASPYLGLANSYLGLANPYLYLASSYLYLACSYLCLACSCLGLVADPYLYAQNLRVACPYLYVGNLNRVYLNCHETDRVASYLGHPFSAALACPCRKQLSPLVVFA